MFTVNGKIDKVTPLLLLLIMLTGCHSQSIAKGKQVSNNADILPNKFDWDLGKAVFKTENSNIVLSTISVKLVLGMLYEGALGNTASEIEHVLNIDPEQSAEYISKFLTVISSLSTSEGHYEFDIGTKVFLDKTTVVNSEYNRKLSEHFNSTVETVNFKDTSVTTLIINGWVRQVTHGRIQELVTNDNAGDSIALLLLNAIYFKGFWLKPFNENLTKEETFYLSDGYEVKTSFMSVVDSFLFNTIPEIDSKIIRLPYVGNKFSMYVMLPNNKTGLGKLIDGFTSDMLRKSISKMTELNIHLKMPRFHFESTLFLAPVLKTLGLKDVFTSNANLTNIGYNTRGGLFVSNVLQKAGLEVNEKGSVAYAATEVEIDNRMGKPINEVFFVNHPFTFIIIDEVNHVIAFVGKVVNPLFHGTPVVSIPIKGPSDEIGTPTIVEGVDVRGGAGSILPTIPVESHISERFNFFDYELLQKISQIKAGNIIISPESIKSALSLVMEGAKGKTEQEIREVLRLSDNKHLNSNLLAHRQIALTEKSPNITLEYQNKIFLAQNEKLNARYQSTIRNQYYSGVHQVNFAQPETVALVNSWVNNATHGLIPNLVNPGDFGVDTKLFLANCIYFKGDWLEQFDAHLTSVNCFNAHGTTCQKAYLMQLKTDVNYNLIKTLDASAIELPYKNPRYAMTILLPNRKDGLDAMLRDLQYHPLSDITKDMSKMKVNIVLPRFTIEYSSSLIEALKLVGIKEVFKDTADLSGMLETKHPLKVDNIIHKAKIEVNEVGSKAAAATGVTIITLSLDSEIDFIANHPFVFFIQDKHTNGILFEGILDSPDVVQDTPSSASPAVVSVPPSKQQPVSYSDVARIPPTARTRTPPSSTWKYQQPQRTDPDDIDYLLNYKHNNNNTTTNNNNNNKRHQRILSSTYF